MQATETRSTAGLLALTRLKGVGPVTAERIARRFRTLDELSVVPASQVEEVTSPSVAASLRSEPHIIEALAAAQRTLDEAERLGVRILTVFDPEYPDLLKGIPDRPLILFVKGTLAPKERCVACIGTREPSDFGLKVTRRIVEQLVGARWAIVSGLALGVDSVAHDEALARGGRTIAALGGGLDSIYPKQNAKLADEILARGGALISEQPFGVPPTPRNLVQRDRLQSGLSVATFVMQTDLKGGSMHTVRFTLEQGRLLFAPVPRGRHADEDKSRGIVALTQQSGAALAQLLGAQGEWKRLLETAYRDHPPAHALMSREQYSTMLDALEKTWESGFDTPRHAPRQQGGLF